MPGRPVGTRLPGADDDALVRRVEWNRDLHGHEARLLVRCADALAERVVPFSLLALTDHDMGHDRHHRQHLLLVAVVARLVLARSARAVRLLASACGSLLVACSPSSTASTSCRRRYWTSSQMTAIRPCTPGRGKASASASTAWRDARDTRRHGCSVTAACTRRHVPTT